MKNLLSRSLYLFLILVTQTSWGVLLAQDGKTRRVAGLSAGMGVSYVKASDIVDYVNQFTTFENRVEDFATAVEFFAAPEISLNTRFSLKAEYAYLYQSYSVPGRLPGTFSFDYGVHMPTALLVYVFEGDGYYVKLGGGVGYHLGKFTGLMPTSDRERKFTGSGVAFKLELMGNTKFSESLYGVIGGDVRLSFIGTLKHNDGTSLEIARPYRVMERRVIDPVKLHFLSVGVKFGLFYYF